MAIAWMATPPADDPELMRFKHATTGEVKGPLYAVGLNDLSDAKYILFASPWVYGGKRAVIYCDGAGEMIPDAEFQAQRTKMAEEGIKMCVESIERLKACEGVKGFHVMAIEWEEKVPGIVEETGLYPRPTID